MPSGGSLPIFEYECPFCGNTHEGITKSRESLSCQFCGTTMENKVSGHSKTPKKWEVE